MTEKSISEIPHEDLRKFHKHLKANEGQITDKEKNSKAYSVSTFHYSSFLSENLYPIKKVSINRAREEKRKREKRTRKKKEESDDERRGKKGKKRKEKMKEESSEEKNEESNEEEEEKKKH